MKRDYHEQLSAEFDRQVENLLQKGYPDLASVKAEEFVRHVEPLRAKIGELGPLQNDANEGRIPFVIVIKNDLVAAESAMPLVKVKGSSGSVNMHPVEPESFKPIEGVQIPDGMAYLLVDIDTGQGTLNVTPSDALNIIAKEQRSPLT